MTRPALLNSLTKADARKLRVAAHELLGSTEDIALAWSVLIALADELDPPQLDLWSEMETETDFSVRPQGTLF